MKFILKKWCLVFFIFLNQPTPVSLNTTSNSTSPEPEPFLVKLANERIKKAETKCLERMETMPPFEGEEMVTKYCDENGVWFKHPETNNTWTNYTMCDPFTPQKVLHMKIMFILTCAGHSLSLITLIISLGIFVYFKNLKCQRVTLHKNLFIAYILNSLLVLIHLSQIATDKDLVKRDPAMCKVLQFFHQYMMACNYYWMLCEGLHLRTLVVASLFVKNVGFWIYYLMGWGAPMLPNLIHAIARATHFNDNCWLSTDTHLLYIIHGPIMGILVLNFFFLLDVIRVLAMKMRQNHVNEFRLYIRVIRAALILTPLLGIQFVLFPLRPNNVLLGQIYDYLMHILVHFQGFSVAAIYCFGNKEVKKTLRRHWERKKMEWCWERHNATANNKAPHKDIAVVTRPELQRNEVASSEEQATEVIPLEIM
ncbi:calcitonin receptor [Rhynchocyon petersi]